MVNSMKIPVSLRLIALLCLTQAVSARAQSEHFSAASEASIVGVSELPVAAFDLLAAGGALSVTAIRPVGESAIVVVSGAADAGAFSLEVSAHVIEGAGVAVGQLIEASAVAGGYLLRAGARVLAFVPDARAHALMHRRELHR